MCEVTVRRESPLLDSMVPPPPIKLSRSSSFTNSLHIEKSSSNSSFGSSDTDSLDHEFHTSYGGSKWERISNSSIDSIDSAVLDMADNRGLWVCSWAEKSYLFQLFTLCGPIYYHLLLNVNKKLCAGLLKEDDTIVNFSGINLLDKDAAFVQRLLRDSSSAKIHRMVIWRWHVTCGKSKVIEIEIEIRTQKREIDAMAVNLSFRTVISWNWTQKEPKPYYISVVADDNVFVCVEDGEITTDVMPGSFDKKFVFQLRYFKCKVHGPNGREMIRFGTVISHFDNGLEYDVTSQLEKKKKPIVLKMSRPIQNPDERFFLEHEVKSEDIVFESLIYLNQCMRYDPVSGGLSMESLGISNSPSETPSDDNLFDTYSEHRGPGTKESTGKEGQNICREDIFRLLPVPEEWLTKSNGDNSTHSHFNVGEMNEFSIDKEEFSVFSNDEANKDSIDGCTNEEPIDEETLKDLMRMIRLK